MNRIVLFALILTLTGCAGYRVVKRGNPFEEDNIRSVAIPMFINKSSYPGLSGPFTREITSLLSTYPELTISTSSNTKADALLIGIIEGPKRYADAFQTTATKFTAGELEESIGERSQFYLPTASTFIVNLRVILIKDPSTEERKLLTSEIGKKLSGNPKIIFQNTFTYTPNFNRESKDTVNSDSGGIVNYPKTRRYFDQTVEQIAKQSANDLQELVLNVF
jgi:hypothetical protein